MPYKYKPGPIFAASIDPERCAAAVPFGGRMMGSHQCSRKPWKDSWCKQHHPDSETKRREESDKRYKAKLEARERNNPYVKLSKANEQIDVLLAACEAAYDLLTRTSDGGYGQHQGNPIPAQLRDAIKRVTEVNL